MSKAEYIPLTTPESSWTVQLQSEVDSVSCDAGIESGTRHYVRIGNQSYLVLYNKYEEQFRVKKVQPEGISRREQAKSFFDKREAIIERCLNHTLKLNYLVKKGHNDVLIKYLLQGVLPNFIRSSGHAAMHTAAKFGNTEAVFLLNEHGGDVNIHGAGGTPLHIAAERGLTGTMEALISCGAQLDIQNAGWTPVYRAANAGRVIAVKLLARHGADLNACESAGWTPLTAASSHGFLETVKVLVEHGVNLELRNSDGFRALDIAIYHRLSKVVIELIKNDISLHEMSGIDPAKNYQQLIEERFANNASVKKALKAVEVRTHQKIKDGLTLHCEDKQFA
ncbi:ankyrin repeat domain-containing protein [Parashewanella curva]|uniref:Ankyrin repeat domain-containing protein n=1 Tax=Parashewanella curva TaxID=2338552 RepID=A0A3L8PYJ9_9GAMM|nr:ankyrin repeat domain-containing protein [Parashewanella curva]RLV59548.1 ankyrin repeat domain-containing protein [Parashewanella curva]